MAIETTTIITCDRCGKREQFPRRWLRVQTLDVPDLEARGRESLVYHDPAPERHFCSRDCLIGWYGERR